MTVIRRAIIEVELRNKGGKFSSPEVGAAARAFQEEKKAVDEVRRSVEDTDRVVRESTRTHQEFGLKSAGAFREAGEGAFRALRGIALLSSSGSEELDKLIKKVAVAQGAFDVFAGGMKLAQFAAAFGPVGIAVAGVATAASLAGLAWQRYRDRLEEVRKAAVAGRQALREYETELAAQANRRGAGRAQTAAEIADLRIQNAATPEERQRRIDAEQARLEREQRAARAEIRQIRDATRLRPGQGFGETSPEMEALLGRFGSFRGIRERQAALSESSEVAARRLLELQSQEYNAARESLDIQRQEAMDNARRNTFSPEDRERAHEAIDARFDSQAKRLAETHEKTMDDLLRAFEVEQSKAEQFRRQVEAGANSR